MNLSRLLRRNLRFHRRANFAVLLGVAVGTAVLTGALLVGDSLRGSLRDQILKRLGGVHYAMILPRFVPDDQVVRNSSNLDEAVIIVKGTIEFDSPEGAHCATDVTIQSKLHYRVVWPRPFNIFEFIRSWFLSDQELTAIRYSMIPDLDGHEALISTSLAGELGMTRPGKARIRVPRVATVCAKMYSDARHHQICRSP